MSYGIPALRVGILAAGLACTVLPASAASEQIVGVFSNRQGAGLNGGLTQLDGVFYGTATFGGDEKACKGGCGTIFRVTAKGNKKVLHVFTNGTDGSSPDAGLLSYKGILYGTAYDGGANDSGVLFSITPSGNFLVLHSFAASNADGAFPCSSLAAINGTIYGTTSYGGTAGQGTIFSVTPAGAYTQLYQFKNSGNDGTTPIGGLALYNGKIYGTTFSGGIRSNGTIYSVTPAGVERVVYAFTGGNDGFWPITSLTPFQGKLYGTTYSGGAYTAGTVFSLDADLNLTTIYTFRGKKYDDGSQPKAALVGMGNTLYGSTEFGGQGSCRNGGCGTFYSIAADNTYSLLYAFAGTRDTADPVGEIVAKNGVLYGTAGGGPTDGGVIYSITP